MQRSTLSARAALVTAALLLPSTPALAGLDILLTNDDGFDQIGVTTLRQKLIDAGHSVTTVAPATQQSGKGGSINTEVFDFTPGVGLMQLTNTTPGANPVWSVAGTPADAAKAGLDIILGGSPPDLIVSGLNFGQNLGKPASNTSGTEGAALIGVFRGIPSIAGSVALDISESGAGFPSTVAAMAPASDFIVSVVAEIEGGGFPEKTKMLNVNFPVPYGDIVGVAITKLGDGADLDLPLFDPSQGFPAFGIPPLPFPSCSSSPVCFAAVGLGFSPFPDGEKDADVDAHRGEFITISPMDGNMSAGKKAETDTDALLGALTP